MLNFQDFQFSSCSSNDHFIFSIPIKVACRTTQDSIIKAFFIQLSASSVKNPQTLVITTYKNLVLMMGRKREPDQRAYFIKFTTYNVLFIEFIKKVFPDVPCIFLIVTRLKCLFPFSEKVLAG